MADQGRSGRVVKWVNAALPWPSQRPGPHKAAINSAFGYRPGSVQHTISSAPRLRWAPRLEHGGMRQADPAPDAAADKGPAGRLSGMRVLVVEDEALVALDLQFALEDEGAIVIGPALSLPDALEIVEREPLIDGAILDVDLAGLEVYPAADLLRARNIPFVFHTGHGSRASLSERFPGSLTCTKPTLPSTLITALLRA